MRSPPKKAYIGNEELLWLAPVTLGPVEDPLIPEVHAPLAEKLTVPDLIVIDLPSGCGWPVLGLMLE
jgi:hypothetical protein